jgi:hypothetical protein
MAIRNSPPDPLDGSAAVDAGAVFAYPPATPFALH